MTISSALVIRDEEGSLYIRPYEEDTDTLERMLDDASEINCFGDCSGLGIEMAIFNGVKYMYDGWKPGMLFVWRNADTKEIAYECRHEDWDH